MIWVSVIVSTGSSRSNPEPKFVDPVDVGDMRRFSTP